MESVLFGGMMAVLYGGPVVALVLLTIGEIILLRKTEWLETTKVLSFSLVNSVCIFIVGVVLFIVNTILMFMTQLTIGMIFLELFEGIGPNLAMVVYSFVLFFVLFVPNWIVFFVVRLLTKRIMVESSGLTWKYQIIFAMLPAAVIASVFPLSIGISSIYEYFNPSIQY